jgi:ABC-type Fe3+-hydroxamate transport system substrate-binding protein
VIDGKVVALVWRGHYVAALFAESSDVASKLESKGFEVVILGENETLWAESTSELAKLLGRPA